MKSTPIFLLVVLISFIHNDLAANPLGFADRSSWVNTIGRAPDQLLFFDESAAGPDFLSTTSQTPINTNAAPLFLVDFYATNRIEFQPFSGTSVFPVVLRNQDFQMSNANGQDGGAPGRFRDALLTNISSLNPTSDLAGRAIRARFLDEVFTFGVRVNNGDGGFVDAFDTNDDLILSQPLVSGGFAARSGNSTERSDR